MPYNRKVFSDDYATETFYFPLSVQVEDEDSEDLYNVSSDSVRWFEDEIQEAIDDYQSDIEMERYLCDDNADIRKCSAFMSQMVTDGHISTEPLCRWTTESIALFDEPALDQMDDLDNIHTLVYHTRQAVLNLDLSQKTKHNY